MIPGALVAVNIVRPLAASYKLLNKPFGAFAAFAIICYFVNNNYYNKPVSK